MFTTRSFSKAILHIDGDAFFASCEVAANPALRGKPVVTGKERGIASAMTYEAKRMGVKRGMALHEIRKVCPEAIILPSDYETYSLYSKRMYDIVRRYTSAVEEYSIDECFADLAGMRRVHRMSYEDIAEKIKHELESELGMTFSIGLAPNKVLAKVASKWKKPDGLTIISGRRIDMFLKDLPCEKVWGIGSNTSEFLTKQGIATALQFANKEEEWVIKNLSKPFQEIWHELRGELIYPLDLEPKTDYASIQKTKTFTPPSRDPAWVFSQLSKNIENACIKARRHNLSATVVSFFLKTQDFQYIGAEMKLSRRSALPHEIVGLIREQFSSVFRPGVLYRATGVTLSNLSHEKFVQLDLFGKAIVAKEVSKIYESVDSLSRKYGKHAVFLGSSFLAMRKSAHEGLRGESAPRRARLFKGETERKRVGMPFLGEVV